MPSGGVDDGGLQAIEVPLHFRKERNWSTKIKQCKLGGWHENEINIEQELSNYTSIFAAHQAPPQDHYLTWPVKAKVSPTPAVDYG